jgi:transposase-like protein
VHLLCPSCGSEHRQVKNGHSGGRPLKKCQNCGRVYLTKSHERGYPASLRQEAVRLYLDGVNLRRIGRMLGVNHQSVAKWVKGVNANHRQLQALEKPLPRRSSPYTISQQIYYNDITLRR